MTNVISGPEFEPIKRSRKASEERLCEALAKWVKAEIEIDFIETPGRAMATYSGNGGGLEYKQFSVFDDDLVQCARKMVDELYDAMVLGDIATRLVDGKHVRATHVAWRVVPEIIRAPILHDCFKCYTRLIFLDASEVVPVLETEQ
jgi:hypothetical protein